MLEQLSWDFFKNTGNIETLLDYPTVLADEHPIMGDWCFYHLFENCTH